MVVKSDHTSFMEQLQSCKNVVTNGLDYIAAG